LNSAAVLLPPAKRRTLNDVQVVLFFLLGTVLGATLTAVVAWVLSGLAAPLGMTARLTVLGVMALFVWLCKHSPYLKNVKLPEARRQIPAEVFGGSLKRGAYQFGFELGTGVRTYAPAAAPYLLLLVLLLGHLTLGVALAIGIGYGLGRAVPLMAQFSVPRTNFFARTMVDGLGEAAPIIAGALTFIGGLTLV
jgi:hypothetical protein